MTVSAPLAPPTPIHRLPKRVSAWVALNTARADLERAIDLVNGALADLTPQYYVQDGPVPVATGKEVQLRRKALGLSQYALAREAYISRSTLCELERGKRETPHVLHAVGQTLARLEEKASRG